jgi:hypothetical protein
MTQHDTADSGSLVLDMHVVHTTTNSMVGCDLLLPVHMAKHPLKEMRRLRQQAASIIGF